VEDISWSPFQKHLIMSAGICWIRLSG
jgi:hypothetical protein